MPADRKPLISPDLIHHPLLAKQQSFSKVEGRGGVAFLQVDLSEPEENLSKAEDLEAAFSRSVDRVSGAPERMAFVRDPSVRTGSIYRPKRWGIPDTILKRLAIQDDAVAACINTRGKHIALFGRERKDRHSIGYVIRLKPEFEKTLKEKADKDAIHKRVRRAVGLLETCGHQEGVKRSERLTLSQFLEISGRTAVTVGRIATEILYKKDPVTKQEIIENGRKVMHRFRPIDAGTIYFPAEYRSSAESLRRKGVQQLQALKEAATSDNKQTHLENIRTARIAREMPDTEDFEWIQVYNGNPLMAFTDDECLVQNFYQVSDFEVDGYPVTPIDTIFSQVCMHINLTTHNKLYFQNGRASRGVMVISSNDLSNEDLQGLKQQMNASINNVGNSHRLPVFTVGTNDKVDFVTLEASARDMEFQFLAENNLRTIFSAFGMSPEEVPGWAHLSKGAPTQPLSESNNQYQTTAARDTGLRDLVLKFQDHINNEIFPLIDFDLAKIAYVELFGLDAETAEKESVRLQQDTPIHGSYNWIAQKVEKDVISAMFGGDVPFNPQLHEIWDKYLLVGEIREFMLGIKDASKDPRFQYTINPSFASFQQVLLAQSAQKQQANEASQMEAPGKEQAPRKPDDSQNPEVTNQNGGDDLSTSIGQAMDSLSKGEDALPPARRRILQQQKLVIKQALDGMEQDVDHALKEIVKLADKHVKPSKKKE